MKRKLEVELIRPEGCYSADVEIRAGELTLINLQFMCSEGETCNLESAPEFLIEHANYKYSEKIYESKEEHEWDENLRSKRPLSASNFLNNKLNEA